MMGADQEQQGTDEEYSWQSNKQLYAGRSRRVQIKRGDEEFGLDQDWSA